VFSDGHSLGIFGFGFRVFDEFFSFFDGSLNGCGFM